ncbi:MAG: carboxymuconolactone decarboxylase family protein [Planctomycetota bacterium]
MSRLPLIDPAHAEGETKDLFDAVRTKMGKVPNLVKALANSPALLKTYLGMSGALGESRLSAPLRERIALALAELNACGYCLSAHTAIGGMLRIPAEEIEAARRGEAPDARDAAAITLARQVLLERGHVRDAQLAAARAAGLDDQDIAEIFGVALLNLFTNWFNHLAVTPIDFPEVVPGVAGAAASR